MNNSLQSQNKQLNNNEERNSAPHDIFDRVFKRIITLSSATIIHFINGIFGTDYPLDSTITYNWTENVDDNLKKTIADTIITINEADSYHLEAQMYKDDESILLRVFDYGYSHSKRHPEDIFDENGIRSGMKLMFPKQIVIYLDSAEGIPDEYKIILVVNDDQEISFSIPTIKFQNESMQEIINKHMIILLPFKLLKVREKFKRAYDNSSENSLQEVIQELRDIYQRDIIKVIEDSYKSGDITRNDMNLLLHLTTRLFDFLYSKYSSIKEVDNMLHDESLDLDIDRYIDTIEDLESKLAKKDEVLAEKDEVLAKKDEEIIRLKKELEQIKNS